MEWEEKVQQQLQVIDEKMDNIEQQIGVTVEKGIALSTEPVVEIPAAVLSMTAGTALTIIGKKAMDKENTVGQNIVAGTAVLVGGATVALSVAKLAINLVKVKKAMDSNKVAKEIDRLIDEA